MKGITDNLSYRSGKTWENMGKHAKRCEKLGKAGKGWENPGEPGKSGRGKKLAEEGKTCGGGKS